MSVLMPDSKQHIVQILWFIVSVQNYLNRIPHNETLNLVLNVYGYAALFVCHLQRGITWDFLFASLDEKVFPK